MEDCQEHLIPDCADINGFPAYYSENFEKCVCRMQDLQPEHMTFNILTCAWDCIPETCLNDLYYWDAVYCECKCYP